MTNINEDNEFLDKLWMSDEAHFHLTGYMNKQNYHYWADSNPKEVHERPLHSSKVTVWCAVSSHGVIGPYLLTYSMEQSPSSDLTFSKMKSGAQ